MDYPLENLTPEKFQQFCQSLIAREFSEVQCFPVGQPDGGRDAIVYLHLSEKREFIVFQVKYVRKPHATTDPHGWLYEVLTEELPKLKNWIPSGAKRFILITNVPGTAHPAVGSIDKVSQLFQDIGIPSQCWWREDINRRLDNAWDIKWSYPEILTGPDLIRGLIEAGLSEHSQRRTSALRAFLADQHSTDRFVRFKQVDLENSLLDLFVDVPIVPSHTGVSRNIAFLLRSIYRQQAIEIASFTESVDIESMEEEDVMIRGEESPIGAAALILHPLTRQQAPFIVLEGAPGQGKSTIIQFVCQINRMHLLGHSEPQLPGAYQPGGVQLPIKVDLRDFATWISGENPFSADTPAHEWRKSLESFLAAQIHHSSGGIAFDVTDLLAVTSTSSVLLALDALDEVADIIRRREVVREIVSGVERLKINSASLQVVVTSRPAAFANSPGLPERNFQHFKLGSLPLPVIEEYTEKWVKARHLQPQAANDVKRALESRLAQPHLRDLARNPMQLAILLSLVHNRGVSLPDKRTALYDSYVDLFFNREAEKSTIVRDNRDVLVNFHRYLAWVLHTSSELGSNRGSIRDSELHQLLANYLVSEGYDSLLAKILFTGMVERVVAIVSRVEGTYEFEVQPLREYFAARFLYDTAPYSPTGRERPGTLPDRFDALAHNFYWLNVTRFYAGCYSKGELSSLINSLQELRNEPGYNLTDYPRALAMMLLSDWVFSQHPKSVRQVIDVVMNPIGLRLFLTSSGRRFASGSPVTLAQECGQEALISQCFTILSTRPPRDYEIDILDFSRSVAGSQTSAHWLRFISGAPKKDQALWWDHGAELGVLRRLPASEISSLISKLRARPAEISKPLFRSQRFDVLESNPDLSEEIVSSLLDCDLRSAGRSKPRSILQRFAIALNPRLYILMKWRRNSGPIATTWEQYSRFSPTSSIDEHQMPTRVLAKCSEFLHILSEVGQHDASQWLSDVSLWDEFIGAGRSLFGEKPVFFVLANASGVAGITRDQKPKLDLNEWDEPLCARIQSARKRAGALNWWKEQFSKGQSLDDRILTLLTFAMWATPHVFQTLAPLIDQHTQSLSEAEWQRLHSITQQSTILRERLPELELPTSELHPRTLSLWAIRLKTERRASLVCRHLLDYRGNDRIVLSLCQSAALSALSLNLVGWEETLDLLSWCYKGGTLSDGERGRAQYVGRRLYTLEMPLAVAKHIAQQADDYPSILVSIAERVCRGDVTSQVIPVGKIADSEDWFPS